MHGKPQNTHTLAGRTQCVLQFLLPVPECTACLLHTVFISRLHDNYTQWGGSGVGAKGVESSEREVTSARASGLKVAVVGKGRAGGDGGMEKWVAAVKGMVGPH